MSHAEVTLPGSANSVPAARHFIEAVVTAWGLPDVTWTAAIVVSELAANAALHARTDFTVGATLLDDGRLHLEVTDGSLRPPQQRTYRHDATTGRGLRLVQEIAIAWGVEDRDAGKTVWVDLDTSTYDSEQQDADADGHSVLTTDLRRPSSAGSSAAPSDRRSAMGGRTDLTVELKVAA